MKRIMKVTLFALALVFLAGLAGVAPSLRPVARLQAQTTPGQVLTLDVAIDCRTVVAGPNRGDLFVINGKIFPGGTLPSGAATFDPTQPVNGVAPIGNWFIRGQTPLPFPPPVAPAYSSAPVSFGTIYYILNDGRALTAEGYLIPSGPPPGIVFSSITGGVGGFSGASGFMESPSIGTNATGCPNARSTFHLVPGSVRGASNN
jgi:hypothetical protein